MIGGIAAAALVLAMMQAVPGAGAQSPAATADAPAWTITRIDTRCVIMRRFGTAPNQVLLGVEPSLASDDSATIVVASDLADMVRRTGRADLSLDDHPIDHAHYVSYGLAAPRGRLMLVDAEHLDGSAIRHASTVRVAGDGLTLRLSLAGLDARWPALDTCLAARRAELHLDPALFSPATPARSINPQSWLSSDDFPPAALSENRSGISEVLWTVGADGRVSDCRIVTSAGGPEFDVAACRAITLRGRYRAARDAAGHPVASYASRRVIWYGGG